MVSQKLYKAQQHVLLYMLDNYHCNKCIIYVRSVETVTHYALKINFEFVAKQS